MMPLAALPAIPVAAALVLVIPMSSRARGWIARGSALAVLGGALTLPWQAAVAVPWMRHDRLGAFVAILLGLAAIMSRTVAAPAAGRIAGQLMLAGMLLAAEAAHPILAAGAMTVAAAAGLVPHLRSGWYRVPLAGAGLGLFLFGSILPPASLGAGCAVMGLVAVAAAVPALAPLLPFLALRFAGPVLVAGGLGALLACGAGPILWPSERMRPTWAVLGQTGLVAAMFGLRAPDAALAGLILSVLLVLSQDMVFRAKGRGLTGLLAAAGLVGLPPFGTFPGLVLAILATGRQSPWLLIAILPGLAAIGWAGIARLPSPRIATSDRWSVAWVPLILALGVGFFLPEPIGQWLRAVAREAVG